MSSIIDTLELFLFRCNLLDAMEIMLENEAYFVEAAFGRIKLFGGAARTVIDEPFVLEAVKFFSIKGIHYSWPLLNEQCCTQPMPRCTEICGNPLVAGRFPGKMAGML